MKLNKTAIHFNVLVDIGFKRMVCLLISLALQELHFLIQDLEFLLTR
jgi:hypothetical protein